MRDVTPYRPRGPTGSWKRKLVTNLATGAWNYVKRNPQRFANNLRKGLTMFKKRKAPTSANRPNRPTRSGMAKRVQTKSVMSTHNDLSTHYCRIQPLGKAKGKTSGMFKYCDQRQAVVSCLPGTGLVQDVQGICTKDQITGTSLSSTRSNGLTWPQSPFDLNPFVQVPTSVLYPGPHPLVVDGDKIKIGKAGYRLDLLNMENIPVEVEVLFLVSNRDQLLSPTAAWNKCIQEEALSQAAPAAAPTVATISGGVGFRQLDSIGNHPKAYASFKKYWRTIGTYKVILQGGDQHSIVSKLQWFKKFGLLETKERQGTYLKGVSMMPMILAHGGLVGIKDGSGAGPTTQVINGPVKLGWKQELEYEFHALPVQRLRTQRIFEGLVEPTGAYYLGIIDDEDAATTVAVA